MEADCEYRTIGGCEIELPIPSCLVIFGASGDLAKRKLIPALYRLHKCRLLPENFFIIGTGRTKMDTGQFREMMLLAVSGKFTNDFDNVSWAEFEARLYYTSFDYSLRESYNSLKEEITTLEKRHKTNGNRVFYLSLPPTAFETVIINLGVSGLAEKETGAYTHIVIEKPFGRDLSSAKRLNSMLKDYFEEREIFRIDHFIAKETVQNIIMFRFANSIFEPLWNNRYIDHIQITAAETLGVEHRAGYYDDAGVIRDMFPNHLLQLLAIIAMEPPPLFGAEMVRDEKVKLFRSLRPLPQDTLNEHIVIGQYGKGQINGEAVPVASRKKLSESTVPGYRECKGISTESVTPTFAAMKLFIDNWRWKGVPFYLRSGKRLSRRKTEISVHFKPVPHMMFSGLLEQPITPNTLILRVQPDEGISLILQTKQPGSKVCINPVSMDFSYKKDIQLDAYEWVLLECMRGDQMLFVREDGVELT